MPLTNTAPATLHAFAHRHSISRTHLRERLAEITVILLILLSILPPLVGWDPDSLYLKWEVVLLPVIGLLYGWLLLAGIFRAIHFNGIFVVASLFSVLVALSIWYGSVILHQSIVLRDFYEFPKLWLPVAFFTIAHEAKLSEASLRRLLSFFAGALALICLYAWAQWGGLEFTHSLDNYYSAGEHVQSALSYSRRVYSTMGNPNVLGQLLTWSIATFLLATVFRVGSQVRNIIVIVACLIALAMTGSRYGLLATALALILVVASSFAAPRPRLSRLALPLVLLPLFAGAILVVSNSNQRTLERFQTLQAPVETDSFRQRADQLWLDALDSFSQSPLLGRGPAKTTFEGIVTDSEFLDVLKKFGLLGFAAYLAFYLFPLLLIWRGMRAARRADPALELRIPATFLVLRLGFVMVLTALIMNVGMSTFYNAVLQSFFFLWIGLSVRSAQSIGDRSLLHSLFLHGQYPR